MTNDKQGLFFTFLKRNNKQIRDDRAQSIGEEAEIVYKRRVEDIELAISRKKRDLENMLDLSPENSFSLMVAEKFDAGMFVTKQESILLEIRNLEITHQLMNEQYKKLFVGSEVKKDGE